MVNPFSRFLGKQPEAVPPAAVPAETAPNIPEEALRKDLDAKFALVKGKEDEFQAEKKSIQEKIKGVNVEVVKNVFKMMESAGVDPGDIESISKFTMELEQQNPDLLELFEKSLMALTPQEKEEVVAEIKSAPEVPGDIDINQPPNTGSTEPPPGIEENAGMVEPPTSMPPLMKERIKGWRRNLVK